MNIKEKKQEVINLIDSFLKNKKTIQDLYDFSWKVIDEFSNLTDQETPIYEETEKSFWFAIWQIQHLADEEHMKDGTLKRELKVVLKYLLNQKSMPPGIYGLRPPIKNEN